MQCSRHCTKLSISLTEERSTPQRQDLHSSLALQVMAQFLQLFRQRIIPCHSDRGCKSLHPASHRTKPSTHWVMARHFVTPAKYVALCYWLLQFQITLMTTPPHVVVVYCQLQTKHVQIGQSRRWLRWQPVCVQSRCDSLRLIIRSDDIIDIVVNIRRVTHRPFDNEVHHFWCDGQAESHALHHIQVTLEGDHLETLQIWMNASI